jgi:hypothetical protein
MSILSSLTDNLTITERPGWDCFMEKLNDLVSAGRVRRITPMKRLLVDNEEWYLDPETGEIYVYSPPDWPFLPKWEKVDAFALNKSSKGKI